MYGYVNGDLARGSIEAFYKLVDRAGAASETITHIDVLDLEGTAASVRVIMEGWHGFSFTDYHTLMKIDGKWKIVSKIYHQH